jgi:hypothetical protein
MLAPSGTMPVQRGTSSDRVAVNSLMAAVVLVGSIWRRRLKVRLDWLLILSEFVVDGKL